MPAEGWHIGVDVGGTFVDLVAVRNGSEVDGGRVDRHHQKQLRDSEDPARTVVEAITAFLRTHAIRPSEVASVRHGTTIATNALLELRDGPVALFTNSGFADCLTLGRQWRRDLDAVSPDFPVPASLCPDEMRFELPCRVDAAGRVVEDLDLLDVERAIRRFAECLADPRRPPAVAVCLLFSPLAPDHELSVAAALTAVWPDIQISLSHRVDPHLREFERTLTTVLDAYVRPRVAGYLTSLAGSLNQIDIAAPWIMRSFGGLAPVQVAAASPASLAMSGPAAAAAAIGASVRASFGEGRPAIGLDVGGTTADVSLHDGSVLTVGALVLNGLELRVRSADILSIPIGGGSLIEVADGFLRVGPHSAGSLPGPICFGRGGRKPTLADACLLAGLLPDRLGDALALDRIAARREFGAAFDIRPDEIAEFASDIMAVAEAKLGEAIRRKAFAAGIEPRSAVLVAAGGAGALHAAEVADLIGVRTVLVPAKPGLLAAAGLLEVSPSDILETPLSVPLGSDGFSAAAAEARRHAERLRGTLLEWTGSDTPVEIRHEIEISYAGQSEGVSIQFSPGMIAVRSGAASMPSIGGCEVTRPAASAGCERSGQPLLPRSRAPPWASKRLRGFVPGPTLSGRDGVAARCAPSSSGTISAMDTTIPARS